MSGPAPITPNDLVKTLKQKLNTEINYRQIDRKGLENYLKNEVGLKRQTIQEVCDVFELAAKNAFDFSGDTKSRLGMEPRRVEQFVDEYRNQFNMEHGQQAAAKLHQRQ